MTTLQDAAAILGRRVVVTTKGSNYAHRMGHITGLRLCAPRQGDLCIGVRFDRTGPLDASETWFAVRELELLEGQ